MSWQKKTGNLTKIDWLWICSCVFNDSGKVASNWLIGLGLSNSTSVGLAWLILLEEALDCGASLFEQTRLLAVFPCAGSFAIATSSTNLLASQWFMFGRDCVYSTLFQYVYQMQFLWVKRCTPAVDGSAPLWTFNARPWGQEVALKLIKLQASGGFCGELQTFMRQYVVSNDPMMWMSLPRLIPQTQSILSLPFGFTIKC